MKIVRISEFSGKENIKELDITSDQLNRFEHRRQTGELVQNIFPKLPPSEREFIMSGITKDEWNEMFPEEIELIDKEYKPFHKPALPL